MVEHPYFGRRTFCRGLPGIKLNDIIDFEGPNKLPADTNSAFVRVDDLFRKSKVWLYFLVGRDDLRTLL
jgi:hypothetical protein